MKKWWIWLLGAAGVYLVFAPPAVFGLFLMLLVWLGFPLLALLAIVCFVERAVKSPKG